MKSNFFSVFIGTCILTLAAIGCSNQDEDSDLSARRLHDGLKYVTFSEIKDGKVVLDADLTVYRLGQGGREQVQGGYIEHDPASTKVNYVNEAANIRLEIGYIDFEKEACALCDGEYESVCDLDVYKNSDSAKRSSGKSDRAELTIKTASTDSGSPSRPQNPSRPPRAPTDPNMPSEGQNPNQPPSHPPSQPPRDPSNPSSPSNGQDLLVLSQKTSTCKVQAMKGATFTNQQPTTELSAIAFQCAFDLAKAPPPNSYFKATLNIKASGEKFNLKLVGLGYGSKRWSYSKGAGTVTESLEVSLGQELCAGAKLNEMPQGYIVSYVYPKGTVKIEDFTTTKVETVPCD